MKDNVTTFIIDFFLNKGKFSNEVPEVFIMKNFIDEKILDSIEFITLISEIEEHFDFLFTEEELQSPLFSSIEGISKIVNSKLG